MEGTQVVLIDPKEYGLEELKAAQIEQSFAPKLVERNGYVAVYEQLLTKEITKEVSKEAGELRKKLVKVRTGIADVHKTEKSFFLASGRYVDALKNKLTLPIEQMEEQLSAIEKHYENLEKQRIENLHNERLALISEFVEDTTALSFGTMEQDVFDAYLTAKKQAHIDFIASELKAEQDRKELERKEAEEREAQRKENERLKKEADKREAEIKAEREEAARLQKIADDKIAKEREESAEKQRIADAKIEAERKAAKEKQDEIQRIADAKAKEQADIIAAQQKEIEDKRLADEAAQKAKQEEEAKAAKEAAKLAKAPIKQQLLSWIDEFDAPKTSINETITNTILMRFQGFKDWAKSEIDKI